jgi:hypothetical protein
MTPSYYAEIEYLALEPRQVRAYYLEWVLGTKRFERLARRRWEAGIDPRWNLAGLHDGGTFIGDHDARIETRAFDGGFVLRMTHRDAGAPSILWHTVVRIADGNKGPTVHHGVARSAPRQVVLEPLVATPKIVTGLLEWNGPNLRPRDIIDASCMQIEEAGVDAFLDHVLLNSKRELPFLLVTPTTATGDFPVDGGELARHLAAMVRVARLATPEASRKLTSGLATHGLDRPFGVFDGGARIYRAPLHGQQSPYQHYLWTGSRLGSVASESRDTWLASEVAAQILRQTVPAGFFQSIEHHDREQRRRSANAVLSKSVPPPPAPTDDAENAALRARQKELEGALVDARKDYDELVSEYENLDARYKRKDEDTLEKEQVNEELREDVDGKKLLIADLQEKLDAFKAKPRNAGLDDALRDAFLAAYHERPTPEQSLRVLMALYPDRVIVHPKAISSAQQSARFKFPKQVFELLMSLAGPYWDALAAGNGNVQAKDIFGKSFSAKESETTMDNKYAKERRTVQYNGEDVVLWAHLKIGVKQDSVAETFRTHFEWLANERRILIGHCGPHLDLR